MAAPFDLPAPLRDLDSPWDRTREGDLKKVAETAGAWPVDRLFALLDALLPAYAVVRSGADAPGVPDEIVAAYPFLFDAYSARMPTFGAVDEQAAVSVLNDLGMAGLSRDVIASTLNDWIRGVVYGQIKVLLDLILAIERSAAPFDLQRHLGLLTAHLADMDAALLNLVIPHVTLLAWEQARPLLRQIAESDERGTDTKAFARRYEAWIDSGERP